MSEDLRYYPLISIVTPVFNQVDYIEDTILSVLNQNYPSLEYIIIDGGSTDGTVDIIKKYSDKLAYWVSEPDGGMYYAIEKGFSKSHGEIMAWINADDMYHRKSLFSVAEIFTTFPQVNWITGPWSSFDKQGRLLDCCKSRPFTRFDILMGDYKWIQQESTFWRRSLWDKVFNVDEKSMKGRISDYKYGGDFFLWSCFFSVDKLYVTTALIGGFRIRKGDQLSSMHYDEYVDEAESIIKLQSVSEEEQEIIDKYRRLKKLYYKLVQFKVPGAIRLLIRFRRNHFKEVPTIRYDFAEGHFKLVDNPHYPYLDSVF